MHTSRLYNSVLIILIVILCCDLSTSNAQINNSQSDATKSDVTAKPTIITLPHSIDYPPLFYVDKTGETKGILADYWRLWSKKSGIEIKFEPYPWHQCMERVLNSESDLVPGIFYTAERDAYFDFSQSFMEVKTNLFARESAGVANLDDLSEQLVGVTRGDRAEDFLKKCGRSLNLKIYDDFESVIVGAADKEIDVFVMDSPSAFYFLEEHGLFDKFISIQTLYVGKFCAAVKEGNLNLLIYVNDGIEHINEEEIDEISNRWIHKGHQPSPEAIRFLLIGGAIFLALLILIHNVVLRYRVRKRTKLLEKAEKKYRQLIENAYEGIAVSRGGKFVFVSPGMTRITGFSSKELTEWDQSYIVHSDDKLFIEDRLSKLKSGRHVPTTYQIKIITKNGQTKWLQISSSSIEWEDQPAELEYIADITDLKRAQETLAKADEHLRAVVNVSPVPIIVTRPENGEIIYANENLRNLIGYEKDDLIGVSSLDFYYDPDDRKKVLKLLTQNGRVDNIEVRMKKLDGTIFWAIFSLVITEISGEKVILGSLYDFSERKKIEEELRLYRELFLNSEDGIVILDAEGNYIESNPIHLKRTGFTVEELRNRGVDGIIGPKSGNIFRDMMTSGRSTRREISAPMKNGSEITVDISAFPIRNKKNEITNFAGIGRDITKQKQAQRDLATRLRYEVGLEGCSSSLLKEISKDNAINKALGYLLEASDASRVYIFENFESPDLGLSMRQLYEVCAEGIQPQIDNQALQKTPYNKGFKRWQEILSKGEAIVGLIKNFPQSEYEMLKQHGIISVLVLPIVVNGQWYGFIGFDDCKAERPGTEEEIRLLKTAAEMIGEYLESKQFEEALRVSEERFRNLVENAKDIIYSMTADGKFSYISPQLTEVTGFEVKEFIGKPAHDFFHPDEVEKCSDWIDMGMPKDDDSDAGFEFRGKTKDGRYRWFTTSASFIKDSDGNIIEAVGIAHDITDMKKALEKIEKANRELHNAQAQLVQSAKMASLGQFVAGIAHEINTPVGAISSMHDTLIRAINKLKSNMSLTLEKEDDTSKKINSIMSIIDEANRVIESGTERVTTIVKRLRSFARLDEADLKTVDIHEGLEDTLTLIHHEIKHNITVIKDYGELPPFACFPGRLNQVYLNIFNNARHAMIDKGELKIKTYQKDDMVYIAISDNGKGIEPENLKRIFDPGFTTKGVGVGTGLGLSICFQIMKEHHGEIWVESELGKGTTFFVTFPTNLSKIIDVKSKKA